MFDEKITMLTCLRRTSHWKSDSRRYVMCNIGSFTRHTKHKMAELWVCYRQCWPFSHVNKCLKTQYAIDSVNIIQFMLHLDFMDFQSAFDSTVHYYNETSWCCIWSGERLLTSAMCTILGRDDVARLAKRFTADFTLLLIGPCLLLLSPSWLGCNRG